MECQETIRSREYRRTKRGAERSRAAVTAYHRRHMDVIRAAKERPCAECGAQLPPQAMHFHHVRDKKRFTIALWKKKFPLKPGESKMDALKAEIAKCNVLCPTCHYRIHTLPKQ
jgi:hypothetical protein